MRIARCFPEILYLMREARAFRFFPPTGRAGPAGPQAGPPNFYPRGPCSASTNPSPGRRRHTKNCRRKGGRNCPGAEKLVGCVCTADGLTIRHYGLRLADGTALSGKERYAMIVILTGAGISQESGLGVYRGGKGLWAGVRVEDLLTPEAFAARPEEVHAFHNALRRELLRPEVRPNAAHLALARLERELKEEVLLVTQNVDNLHERAGSVNLVHMHGERLKVRCTLCGDVLPWEEDLSVRDACPSCGRAAGLRPAVVWFREQPLHLDTIEAALQRCRLFVSIGTSGNVYPAAGFVSRARACGAKTLELNLEPSLGAARFHAGRYGRATEIVPVWVEDMIEAACENTV